MSNNAAVVRSLTIYAICVPLAIILGFLLTDPLDRTTDVVLSILFVLLMLPLLFKWYQAWLLCFWNMTMVLTFLPGAFPGWMPLAFLGFTIAIGHYVLNRDRKFMEARSVTYALLFIGLVVAVTAKFRGGIGFRALGDEAVGGKRYLWIWATVLAYFALISQRVPPSKRMFYTALFLLGPLTGLLSDFGGHLGPVSRFLDIFFPNGANAPAMLQSPVGDEAIGRLGGLTVASVAIVYFLTMRFGIQGILNLRKFWIGILFLLALAASLGGGYRSAFIGASLTLMFVFYFEGMFRSRLMPIFILGGILACGIIVGFSNRLPLQMQRSLAFLPLNLDPVAKMSAEASSDWRLQIWEYVLPQVPHYLLLGKGLTFDINDMANYQTISNQVGGDVGGLTTLAGDYHNGPLSVIIPFGIWGAIGFIWFLIASFKVLWANYKYGDPEIRKINTFLLSYFASKTLIFFVIFGGFFSDLILFAGIVGLSVCLNNGVARPVVETQPQMAFNRNRLMPMRPSVMSS